MSKMDIGKLLMGNSTTIPMLKGICEQNQLDPLRPTGSSKAELTQAILEHIGVDKRKEKEVRDTIDQLKREKTNKTRQEIDKNRDNSTKKTVTILAEVHASEETDTSQKDLFGKSQIDPLHDESGTTESSEAETVVGDESTGDIGIQPRSTSSAIESRSESVTTDMDGELDETTDDRRVMKALLGHSALLDDSVFAEHLQDDNVAEQKEQKEQNVRGTQTRSEQQSTQGKLDWLIIMMSEMKENRESESHQTQTYISTLKATITELKEMNGKAFKQIQQLIQSKENNMKTIKEQANVIMEISKKTRDERSERDEEQKKCVADLRVLTSSLRNVETKLGGMVMAPETASSSLGQRRVQDRQQMPQTQVKSLPASNYREVIMVIGDSNSTKLIPSQLHNQKEVKILRRSTIQEATENIPTWEKPEKVTDIVIQLGDNDMRRGATADEITTKTFNLQSKYHRKFKNARFHLTSLPPTDTSREEANSQLRVLAQSTGSNFISLKGLKDRNSGSLRANMIQNDGIHYTEVGFKTLAKEMKRSLYSTANQGTSERISDAPTVNQGPSNRMADVSRLQRAVDAIMASQE